VGEGSEQDSAAESFYYKGWGCTACKSSQEYSVLKEVTAGNYITEIDLMDYIDNTKYFERLCIANDSDIFLENPGILVGGERFYETPLVEYGMERSEKICKEEFEDCSLCIESLENGIECKFYRDKYFENHVTRDE